MRAIAANCFKCKNVLPFTKVTPVVSRGSKEPWLCVCQHYVGYEGTIVCAKRQWTFPMKVRTKLL